MDRLVTLAPAVPYRSALDALFARTTGHIKPGLERTLALLDALGNPQHRFPAFHVAGTNGKGSTCAMLEALLRFPQHGRRLKVGRYTSPHLVDFRERVLVDGVPPSEARVVDFLTRIQPAAESTGATFFEITTAMAFAFFAEDAVDIAVLETGMGGRWDSTNVVTPVVATVTNISLDHAEYLGSDLYKIADEKAGIFKAGCPAVIVEPDPGMAEYLRGKAVAAGASSVFVVRETWVVDDVRPASAGTHVVATTPVGPVELDLSLYGAYQAANAMGALATLQAAGAPYTLDDPVQASWANALRNVVLPGRFQRSGDWIFDVAHNPAGSVVLASTLDMAGTFPVTALFGVLGDKDWRGMIDTLAPYVARWIIAQPASAPRDRQWAPEDVVRYIEGRPESAPVVHAESFDHAVELLAAAPGLKLVTGSFHTVGDAMRLLGIDPLAKDAIPGPLNMARMAQTR